MPVTFDRAVVVIPAHDEADKLPQCLKAIVTAAACLDIPVLTVVVLDACTDGSAALAGRFGADVHFVEVDAKNVGAARAAGFTYARRVLDDDDSRVWYATTDADSRVDPDWLVRQMAADVDMVLGVVRITNWQNLSAASVRRYLAAYRAKSERRGGGHGHVHGANMGFRADSYWAIGGFAALASREDVDLVRRFERDGRRIHRDPELSVETSARREGRAPKGFANYLRGVARRGDVA
ncbi:glycosyl transferase [Mycolicibacterium madagascariense]|uniref:4,4'-diaponeurosporenoate glycosyltransferase n=1 Tax=Mycolicibacterium madagascariense TaxID=212765 RepID=A0A7I7XLL4_9MYCO|nr:glycosyltransferase [Mycolicibacterium madagascariense]MCV7012431.1 glycosyltransferase [Mycolicibacterium madagascariense]BBZ30107.1 glycosyl transferase [Mycolicibacterium madagascariense]